MTSIYLATAIDFAETNTADGLVPWFSSLDSVSWVYNPAAAFTVGLGPLNSGIRRINADALAQCDVLFAYLPAGTTSIGVPMEIEAALRQGLEVVVVSDARSWMLEEPRVRRFYHWNRETRTAVANIVDQAHHRLQETGGLVPMEVTLDDGAAVPHRGHEDDAGLDIYVSEDTVVPPGEFVDVRSGVRAEIPEGCWGLVTGRSSSFRRRGLLVHQGVIDAGYRGELFAGVSNPGDEPVHVKAGERLAQLVLIDNATARYAPVVVPELRPSLPGARGTRGFGSTGS